MGGKSDVVEVEVVVDVMVDKSVAEVRPLRTEFVVAFVLKKGSSLLVVDTATVQHSLALQGELAH